MFNRFKPKYKHILQADLYSILPRDIVYSGNAHLSDKFYRLPLDPKYIMMKVPSHIYKYSQELNQKEIIRDCDDAVRIFRGWLSQKNWGNIVAMSTRVLLPKNIPHALISFIDLDRKKDINGKCHLLFGEPQQGVLINRNIGDSFTNIKLII